MKNYDPTPQLFPRQATPPHRAERGPMRQVDQLLLNEATKAPDTTNEGAAPTLQAACAAIGGLLLLGILAYVIAAVGLNLAGELPPGTELWSSCQYFR